MIIVWLEFGVRILYIDVLCEVGWFILVILIDLFLGVDDCVFYCFFLFLKNDSLLESYWFVRKLLNYIYYIIFKRLNRLF